MRIRQSQLEELVKWSIPGGEVELDLEGMLDTIRWEPQA